MASPDLDVPLSRTAASEAVLAIGWRYLLGALAVSVPVRSLAQAGEVAAAAVTASGPDADGHLRADLRRDRVEFSVQTRSLGAVTGRDVQLAHSIANAVAGLGLAPTGATSAESPRPVQMLEIAIDALERLPQARIHLLEAGAGGERHPVPLHPSRQPRPPESLGRGLAQRGYRVTPVSAAQYLSNRS